MFSDVAIVVSLTVFALSVLIPKAEPSWSSPAWLIRSAAQVAVLHFAISRIAGESFGLWGKQAAYDEMFRYLIRLPLLLLLAWYVAWPKRQWFKSPAHRTSLKLLSQRIPPGAIAFANAAVWTAERTKPLKSNLQPPSASRTRRRDGSGWKS